MSEYTPFKMKGSPMQRNFGIGSPVKTDPYGHKTKNGENGKKDPEPTKLRKFPEATESGPPVYKDMIPGGGDVEVKGKEKGSKEPTPSTKVPEPKRSTVVLPTVNVPKGLKSGDPDKNKGTLKGVTEFEYDVVNPVKGKIRKGIEQLKNIDKTINVKPMKTLVNVSKKAVKRAYDYFTKK